MTCHPDDTTIVIPAIPPRARTTFPLLLESITRQTHSPAALAIATDICKRGAADTRQRALDMARTPWVAFADDDDLLYPHHLETLHRLAADTGADYVWTWFDGNDPFPMHRGRQMDPANPHHTTMTVMVRTELAQSVGFTNHPDASGEWPGEDWNFILGCAAAGAVFAHDPTVTWTYVTNGANTSGLANRW